jgi:hypothetical protein
MYLTILTVRSRSMHQEVILIIVFYLSGRLTGTTADNELENVQKVNNKEYSILNMHMLGAR